MVPLPEPGGPTMIARIITSGDRDQQNWVGGINGRALRGRVGGGVGLVYTITKG